MREKKEREGSTKPHQAIYRQQKKKKQQQQQHDESASRLLFS
jgi:hypothetical protein